MKRKLTLLQAAEQLKREEIVRYASNVGVEFGEDWDISQMRKAYADYVLANPKALLSMLPAEDIRILKPTELDRPGEPRSLVNTHTTPVFVQYGLAVMEVVSGTEVEITIPDDFFQAIAPHLDWVMADEENNGRIQIEIMVVGLTNLYGIVTQQDIKKYLIELCRGQITDEQAEETIAHVRGQSLLLDSMEWREQGDETKEEDVLCVSRYGWDDKAAMKHFIEERAAAIPSPRQFTSDEVVNAAIPFSDLMPNEKSADFMEYLTHVLRLDVQGCNLICFMVWYNKMMAGREENADQLMEASFLSFGMVNVGRDITEQQLEEGIRRLTDYANHMPLWHLRGFTATDYPSEAYVPMRKAKLKGPLGKELKKMVQEAQWMIDVMKSMDSTPSNAPAANATDTPANSWANMKIGRNDPCPCGSGLKYKKCHGKDR